MDIFKRLNFSLPSLPKKNLKFISEHNSLFNLDKIRLYNINNITNSFFKKGKRRINNIQKYN